MNIYNLIFFADHLIKHEDRERSLMHSRLFFDRVVDCQPIHPLVKIVGAGVHDVSRDVPTIVSESSNAAFADEFLGSKTFIDKRNLRKKKIFYSADDKASQVAMSAYKALRTQVLHKTNQLGVSSVLVSGPTMNVGKTLTAINLALALARHKEQRVILVDLDLRSPSVHHIFDFTPNSGIVDVAQGTKQLEDVLVASGIDGLTILPGTVRAEDSSELLVSDTMLKVFDTLNSLPDTFIVYDTPPILGCDDVAAIAPFMDACLLVVRQDDTSTKELQQTLNILGTSINLLGVTVNRSSEGELHSYYY